MHIQRHRRSRQRGVTLIGLVLWAIVIAFVALIGMRVFPTVNEYWTILRAVNKIIAANPSTVAEVRTAFDKQKEVEYSITSISGKDLEVTKVNDRLVIRVAYDKEVEIHEPVYLLIKYRGEARQGGAPR
jgi:ABC-type Na+ efflux pump permease subunit